MRVLKYKNGLFEVVPGICKLIFEPFLFFFVDAAASFRRETDKVKPVNYFMKIRRLTKNIMESV